jgi:hypothetical protein
LLDGDARELRFFADVDLATADIGEELAISTPFRRTISNTAGSCFASTTVTIP